MTSRSRTVFSLFIIESLRFEDEEKQFYEGKLLTDILRMSRQIEVEYLYIRTRAELAVAIQRFHNSSKRYLHISCHGNPTELGLTLEGVPFDDFADLLAPYMDKDQRLFFSACSVVNRNLADVVMQGSGCRSIIGPKEDISFGDAALMWASFYHLMFRDETRSKMTSKRIASALRRIHHAFRREFVYFTRADNERCWDPIEVNRKRRS
jgi:hypothetical protein